MVQNERRRREIAEEFIMPRYDTTTSLDLQVLFSGSAGKTAALGRKLPLTNESYCISILIQSERRRAMEWQIDDSRPIWMQLSEQLTRRIVSGQYPKGTRLPSVRELAAEAGVN